MAYTLHLYPVYAPDEPDEYDEFVTLPYYGDGEGPYPTDTPVWEEFPLFFSEWGYEPGADLYAGGGVNDSNENTTVDPDYDEDLREWFIERSISWKA